MSDVLLCLAVGALVVLDGGFAGYRARAGRYALIRRMPHDLRAVRRGCIVAGVAAVLALVGAVALAQLGPNGLAPEARLAAWRILFCAGGYATLVILAFAPFLQGSPDIRSLTTVVVFGPLTLFRPLVVIAACAVAAWGQPPALIAALAWGGGLVLAQDVLLDRLGRRDPRI